MFKYVDEIMFYCSIACTSTNSLRKVGIFRLSGKFRGRRVMYLNVVNESPGFFIFTNVVQQMAT